MSLNRGGESHQGFIVKISFIFVLTVTLGDFWRRSLDTLKVQRGILHELTFPIKGERDANIPILANK